MIKVRDYAKYVNFRIKGKLTYKGSDKLGYRWYTDEDGNEFLQGVDGFCIIIDKDGGVW